MMNIPTSTYRIQFTPLFTFADALELVPYLDELGAGCLYASPIFKAKKGQSQLNPELGTADTLDRLFAALRERDMVWLQDFVPNHMAYDYENVMLADVLEAGEQSAYHSFFDVDWNHAYESIRGRLLAPFLGKPYSEALENREIQLAFDGGQFLITYYDLKFPVALKSYSSILTHNFEQLKHELGENSQDYIKLLGVLYVFESFTRDATPDEWSARARFAKQMLSELYAGNQRFRAFLDRNIETFNGQIGDTESFSLLDSLLNRQFYRLAFWKVATEEINYRRFFSINSLISLRMQEPEVFQKTHSLVLRLIREGKIAGLRIDHIDGLCDPAAYIEKLRSAAPEAWLIVEKILAHGERLPPWRAQGTTGYDFANYVNGLFCDSRHERKFTSLYARFTKLQTRFDTVVYGKKRGIVANHMKGDIDNLALALKKVSGRYRQGSDITLYGLKRAIIEVLSHFPVYRTYCNSESCSIQDAAYIRQAVRLSHEAHPALHYELNFLEKFLLLDFDEYTSADEREMWIDFVMKFQQYSGPLMAKGFEDTALYVYNRLLSLNEVGGFPGRFGVTPGEFHAFNQARARDWQHTINASSTHDTKRGEDARARINVLSEMPELWTEKLRTMNTFYIRRSSVGIRRENSTTRRS